MGKWRWLPAAFTLVFLAQRLAIGQQPFHWDASIDSAKATASHSNRLVLVFFCAGYCGPCHRMENDLRNQPGAVNSIEANFVPVKISAEYYPNTAKQYGVTRLPTTVILTPDARGDVLANIPEYVPVDQYLSRLSAIAADAKRRNAGVFAQVQVNPPVGSPTSSQPPVLGTAFPAGPPQSGVQSAAASQALVAGQEHVSSAALGVGGPSASSLNTSAPGAPANSGVTTPAGSGLLAAGSSGSGTFASSTKPASAAPLGLDGFCPVQLVENARWQEGKRAWGAIHRGRTYLFTGEEERRRFLANPDRYAPVSSGNDVVLLLEQGRVISGYREHGLQFEGHVYLFKAESTLDKFRSNPRYYAERALQAMLPAGQTAAVR